MVVASKGRTRKPNTNKKSNQTQVLFPWKLLNIWNPPTLQEESFLIHLSMAYTLPQLKGGGSSSYNGENVFLDSETSWGISGICAVDCMQAGWKRWDFRGDQDRKSGS